MILLNELEDKIATCFQKLLVLVFVSLSVSVLILVLVPRHINVLIIAEAFLTSSRPELSQLLHEACSPDDTHTTTPETAEASSARTQPHSKEDIFSLIITK